MIWDANNVENEVREEGDEAEDEENVTDEGVVVENLVESCSNDRAQKLPERAENSVPEVSSLIQYRVIEVESPFKVHASYYFLKSA